MNFKDIREKMISEVAVKTQPPQTQPNDFEKKVRAAKSVLGLKNLNVSAVVAADKVAQKNAKIPYNQLLNKLSPSNRKHYVDFQSAVPSDVMSAPLQSYQQVLQRIKPTRKALNNSAEIKSEDALLESMDPPMMLILKRKGIRLFPDGKRAALYVNEKLNLTFMLPYGGETSGSVANVQSEEVVEFSDNINENIEHLQTIAKSKKPKTLKFKTGETLDVDPITADAIHKVHSALNDDNKIKVADMLSHSPTKFKQVALFALKNVTHKIDK
jgi:hypothetical protein